MDSIYDKTKISPIQINQNFKTPCTGLQRGSVVCVMATGAPELVAKLVQGLRSTLGASQTYWCHFALWGSVWNVAILQALRHNEKFGFDRVGENHRVVGSLLDCSKWKGHRAPICSKNPGVNRASLHFFRHGQSRIFRYIFLVFLAYPIL